MQVGRVCAALIEVDVRSNGVRGRANTKIVLDEEHLRDLPNRASLVFGELAQILGRSKDRAADFDRSACLQEGKNRNAETGLRHWPARYEGGFVLRMY